MLPDNYEILSEFIDILLCGKPFPVYPFSGFILNINITSRIYHDKKNKNICLVLALSDGNSGELCLLEPGLVLALKCGDIVIFDSGNISHFNMYYIGRRASIAFHSDKLLDSALKQIEA